MGSLASWITQLPYAGKLALASGIVLALATNDATGDVAIWVAVILALIVWGIAGSAMSSGSQTLSGNPTTGVAA